MACELELSEYNEAVEEYDDSLYDMLDAGLAAIGASVAMAIAITAASALTITSSGLATQAAAAGLATASIFVSRAALALNNSVADFLESDAETDKLKQKLNDCRRGSST
ncbi:MAG: hypothetical protein J0L86_07870 [Flavobacteriales bacterium]|nr:hypothetical protein [Flavobacteriales bacterium]